MNTAHCRTVIMAERKKGRRKRTKVVKEKDWTVKVDVLLGDGKAEIGKTRTIKHGLPFGAYAISDATTVKISCNQDLKTIKRAHKAAVQLLDRFVTMDEPDMLKRLHSAEEELYDDDEE